MSDAIANLKTLRKLVLGAYSNEPYPHAIFELEDLDSLAFVNLPQEHDGAPLVEPDGDRHLGRLRQLQVLGVIDSCVYSLPDELAELSALEELNLYNSQSIESVPAAIASLAKLRRIEVRGTQVGKLLPAVMRGRPGLEIVEGETPAFDH